MFRAMITSAADIEDGAVAVSGDAAPYDLQLLREHLLQMCRRRGALQVDFHAAADTQPRIRAHLGDLGRHGVTLVFHAAS